VLIRLLRVHLRPHGRPVALVLLLQLVQALANLYLPKLNGDIIDTGVVNGDTGYILRAGGTMLAVTLAQIATAATAVYVAARTATAFGRDVRAAVFRSVQRFSVREVGRFGTASLITRTTNDVQQVQTLVLMTLTLVVAAPVMFLGGGALALRQDAPLSAALLVVTPLLVGIVALVSRPMGRAFRAAQTRLDQVNRVMREQITGIRVIRAFVRDEHEQARFAEANTGLFAASLRAGRLMALLAPAMTLVFATASLGVVWFGAHRIDSGAMQVGALVAFVNYLTQILMAVMMATFMLLQVPRAQVSAERITEVLLTRSSVTTPPGPVTFLSERGLVELRGVEFRYPGAEEPLLRDITLTARPGTTTAIVGSTGSGKTTLLGLVARLFDATGGTVLLDGIDVRELVPQLRTRMVGLVPQRPYLFSGTVASNLRYGDPHATDADLWHALETAQARDFVERLPGGLAAPVAQGGTNLSGGQRQRLAIARTLVARPRVHLLDDSFSALDHATDAALRAALAREIGDATLIVVAQRVATIRNADQIVVLDAGRIAATGTHQELLRTSPTYREIASSQSAVEEAA
jgi:ATP-binding cassette, subfamily B, multidrug efflux pump